MNNAFITETVTLSETPQTKAIQDREAKLMRMIGAIKKVIESEVWSSLKTEVFDSLLEENRKELFHEARKDQPNTHVLAKLNGKYDVLKKYHDLAELGKVFQAEFTNLKIKYGKTQQPESE